MISINDFEKLVKEARKMYDLDMKNYQFEEDNHEDHSSTIKHFNGLIFSINEAYEILLKGIEGNYFNKYLD